MPVSPADARAGSLPLGSRACMSHAQAARGHWAQATSRVGVRIGLRWTPDDGREEI